jgi:hypothetical protein
MLEQMEQMNSALNSEAISAREQGTSRGSLSASRRSNEASRSQQSNNITYVYYLFHLTRSGAEG